MQAHLRPFGSESMPSNCTEVYSISLSRCYIASCISNNQVGPSISTEPHGSITAHPFHDPSRLKRLPTSMHQITTLASQRFRYVSRSRTSCVGYHLTDPASSMMPHQRLRMGGWESGSWSKRQRIVSMAAAPHPSTPNLIRPSAITHQKFKRFLSSRLHALKSDLADCYFDAFSHKSFMHLVIVCQSKFNFYIFIGKKRIQGSWDLRGIRGVQDRGDRQS